MNDDALRARVLALLERATHPGTPEEEARTTAMIACRLLVEHRLLEAPAPPAPAPDVIMPPSHYGRRAWVPYDVSDLPPPPEPRAPRSVGRHRK